MPIASTTIINDRPQRDGRRCVSERHVDHVGVALLIHYIAAAGADVLAVALARVADLNQALIDRELAKDIAAILDGRYADVTTVHAAIADVRAALRTFYQTASGPDVGRMAGYLLTLTDAQLRTLFNMTQAQVGNLRTRLQARVDALNAVLTAVGE
jgi:hypothetical protein